jgi:hypothetical protein
MPLPESREQMMTKLRWKRDGDQRVSQGDRGEYRITEWVTAGGSTWALALKSSSTGALLDHGGYPALQHAKDAADDIDNGR